MKALLIIHDLHQDDNYFPLGPAYLASIMREKGVEVTVACQDIYHWSNDELVRRYIKGKEWDIIGLGFLSARFTETVLPLCKEINKHKGDAKLVLGGIGSTTAPEYTQKVTDANIIACGELENGIMDIFDMEDCIFHCPPVKKLDTIPFPAWDLFPMDKYINCIQYQEMDPKEKSMQIVTSRGCINKCTFCSRTVKGIRLRSPQNIVKEMKELYDRYNITYFEIQDELFIPQKKRLLGFIDELKKADLLGKVKYAISIRADLVKDETVRLLKGSGCKFISIGFESVTQEVLDEMKKNVTVEDNYNAARILKKHNMLFGINFIWGMPSDNEETLQKSVNFMKKFNSYSELRTIRMITPYPGSELYYDALDQGLLSGPQDFFDKFKNSDLITVNFTKYSTEDCYKMLFEANCELINDHFMKRDGWCFEKFDNAPDRLSMIQDFHDLYFGTGDKRKFRGARHYEKK